MSPRRMAIARCGFCRWTAQLSGDDYLEVATSLRKLLLDHVRDDHPEKVGDNVMYYPLPPVPP